MNLKKLGLAALFTVIGSSALGASIDHIQNYTAEYDANPAQQAAISPTTSAYYNPAGLMKLENGNYFTAGIQFGIGKEKMKYDGNDYEADLLQPIPNLAWIKKTDDRAYFWTFGALAGGGGLDYEDGVAGIKVLEDVLDILPGINTDGSWAKGDNAYAQTTIGTAWNINSKLSMSVGGRVVYGWRTLEGKLKAEALGGKIKADAYIDSERTAWGFGGQIGLNYAYDDTWSFAMRYDTKVKMEFEADASEKTVNLTLPPSFPNLNGLGFGTFFPQYKDGAEYRRDLPAILAVGASQKVTDKWTMFYGANYYFNESAKIDKDVPGYSYGLEYDNGWEISVGTEYWLNNKWAVLAGANYADTGAPKDSYSDVEYALNSFSVGMGLKYRPDEDTEWVFATNHYFYESADGNFAEKYNKMGHAKTQRYDKDISSVGISYTKKF